MAELRGIYDTGVNCPRCSYDLRGVPGTWETACPLAGICAECGLEFGWAETLHPEKFEPWWCIEFVGDRSPVARAGLATFLRSFRPFQFWTAIQMPMRIRWRRLAVYVALLAMPILLGYVSLQTTVAVRVRIQSQQEMLAQKRHMQQFVARWMANQSQSADPGTLQQMRAFQAAAATPGSITHSYSAAIMEAVVFPLGSTSRGVINDGSWVRPYVAPRHLHMALAQGQYPMMLTFVTLAAALWVWLILPLTFVLLPISRRRARVRWCHLVRVWAYGLFIPSALVTASLLAASIGYVFESRPALNVAHFGGRWFLIPMLVIWWAAAVRQYLQIRHSWAIVVLLSTLSLLLYVAGLVVLFSDKLFSI